MDHLQFEEWLFSEKKLDSIQQNEYHQHMDQCDSCRALATAMGEVDKALIQAEFASPASGFTVRWEQRLEDDLYRRGSWKGWLVMSVGAILILSLWFSTFIPTLSTTSELLSNLLDGFTNVMAFFGAWARALESVGRLLPGISSGLWFSAMSLSIVTMVSIWLVALKQFAFKQGV